MSTVYEFRENVKAILMQKLYQKQLSYWSTQLIKLSNENAHTQGRKLWYSFNNVELFQYSIYFRDKKWSPQYLEWTADIETAYCTSLNPDYPEFQERMARIADELTDIDVERYEVERFLSGLMLFGAPPEEYLKVLGRTLYQSVKAEITAHEHHGKDWNRNASYPFKQYTAKNKRIVVAMNERLMMNLIAGTPSD